MMRNKDEMLILGLTGGIGCGKTAVLTILKEEYDAYIIEADRLAHELMEPGKTVYQGIVDAFGMEVLMDADIDISAPAEGNAVTDNGQSTVNRSIDRKKLGDIVFHDKDKLALLNSISHPLVKEEIVRRIEEQKDVGKKLFVIEAALLIQDGYKSICDKICLCRLGCPDIQTLQISWLYPRTSAGGYRFTGVGSFLSGSLRL